MMSGPRKKAPKTIAVIDPDRCFGAFACSICQAACPVAGCIVEEKDRDGRMVCAVRADLCIGCGLCVTLGNPPPLRFASSAAARLRRHQHDAVRDGGEGARGVRERGNDDVSSRVAVGCQLATADCRLPTGDCRLATRPTGDYTQFTIQQSALVPASCEGIIKGPCGCGSVTLLRN